MFVEYQYDKIQKFIEVQIYMCVYSNANPLHYYALQVPRTVEDGIECGTFICIVYCRKLRLGWLYV